MNYIFYRAIKAQKNLDKVMPRRNWPVDAKKKPAEHIIETARLYRAGYTQKEIAKKLNISIHSVRSTTRRIYIEDR